MPLGRHDVSLARISFLAAERVRLRSASTSIRVQSSFVVSSTDEHLMGRMVTRGVTIADQKRRKTYSKEANAANNGRDFLIIELKISLSGGIFRKLALFCVTFHISLIYVGTFRLFSQNFA
jgi:hypothetical protein